MGNLFGGKLNSSIKVMLSYTELSVGGSQHGVMSIFFGQCQNLGITVDLHCV